MPPKEESKSEQVDLTRLNRKERRNIGNQMGTKIMGRNLPYHTTVPDESRPGKNRYMSLQEFNARRILELETEKKAMNTEKLKFEEVQSINHASIK